MNLKYNIATNFIVCYQDAVFFIQEYLDQYNVSEIALSIVYNEIEHTIMLVDPKKLEKKINKYKNMGNIAK